MSIKTPKSLLIILLPLFIYACKQPNSGPKATFTIKGRVLNGTTGVPFGNEDISASVHVRTKTGNGEDLGTSQTGCELISLYIPNFAGEIAAIADGIYRRVQTNPTNKHKGLEVNIFSASFGGPGLSYDELNMIGLANKAGIVFVASRGNSGKNDENEPATIQYDDLVISVGACETDGEIKHDDNTPYTGMSNNRTDYALGGLYSSWGSKMDVIAPGTSNLVYTVDPVYSGGATFTNTSAACPHVAALAGLMLSISNENYRLHGLERLYPEDVQNIIKNTAEDRCVNPSIFDGSAHYPHRDPMPGYDQFSGWGLINAGKALSQLDYPNYKILHNTSKFKITSTDLSALVSAGNDTLRLLENYKIPNTSTTIKKGKYRVFIYPLSKYTPLNTDAGYHLINAWARGSASNLLGLPYMNDLSDTAAYHYLFPNANYATMTSLSGNIAYFMGYVYKIVGGPYNGTWLPFDPTITTVTLSYSIHEALTSSIKQERDEIVSAKSFPVPATNSVALSYFLPEAGNISLDIFSIDGKEINTIIDSKEENSGEHRIDYGLVKIRPGVYIFRLTYKNQYYYEKFIKTE